MTLRKILDHTISNIIFSMDMETTPNDRRITKCNKVARLQRCIGQFIVYSCTMRDWSALCSMFCSSDTCLNMAVSEEHMFYDFHDGQWTFNDHSDTKHQIPYVVTGSLMLANVRDGSQNSILAHWYGTTNATRLAGQWQQLCRRINVKHLKNWTQYSIRPIQPFIAIFRMLVMCPIWEN